MKSKLIAIHTSGNGFEDANREVQEFTVSLTEDQKLNLCLITEELLSMLASVGGDVNAEFWAENEENTYYLHVTAKQKLGNVQRAELLESATSGDKENHKGFLGKLRDMFVQAMSVGRDIDRYYSSEGYQSQAVDITDAVISTPKWDKYERSVLLGLADDVHISIKNGLVDLTVTKKF